MQLYDMGRRVAAFLCWTTCINPSAGDWDTPDAISEQPLVYAMVIIQQFIPSALTSDHFPAKHMSLCRGLPML